jgi:hypothetical protein
MPDWKRFQPGVEVDAAGRDLSRTAVFVFDEDFLPRVFGAIERSVSSGLRQLRYEISVARIIVAFAVPARWPGG